MASASILIKSLSLNCMWAKRKIKYTSGQCVQEVIICYLSKYCPSIFFFSRNLMNFNKVEKGDKVYCLSKTSTFSQELTVLLPLLKVKKQYTC